MIDRTQVFETTWWQPIGQTPCEDTPSGGRLRSTIFRCIETGEQTVARELPVGALYSADRDHCKDRNGWPPAGADGLAIACVCISNQHWYIDGRASNCTKPDDKEHRCWVRHGTVGEKLTVDKNGLTCAAGAGSFFMGPNQEWHGFLRNGKLTP